LLASVPVRKSFSAEDPVLGEAFDVLRANLAFLSHERPLQVLTLSSFNPREGKSSTVEGLAYAAARGGLSVVVVDGDVRTRTLSARLGHGADVGLTNVVVGAVRLDEALVEIAPGVSLLPVGPTPPNPPSLLSSRGMAQVIDDLRMQFSLVLIDSPPVAHLADASILASVSDGVVVVARVGLTKRTDLATAGSNLRHSPTPIVGFVLLERRSIDETYYPAVSKGVPTVREPAETVETI
jgi:non-specific protein-tyrosine kinase